MHPSHRGRRLGGGGGGRVVVGSTCPFIGSWCSLVWERRTTCWVTIRVPDPNILVVQHPPPFREGWDFDHHVSACSVGARACWGGGLPGLLSVRPHFCWGEVGAAKGLLPCFLVPKGNQPMACTLALRWLKFGPTEQGGGGESRTRTEETPPREKDTQTHTHTHTHTHTTRHKYTQHTHKYRQTQSTLRSGAGTGPSLKAEQKERAKMGSHKHSVGGYGTFPRLQPIPTPAAP